MRVLIGILNMKFLSMIGVHTLKRTTLGLMNIINSLLL